MTPSPPASCPQCGAPIPEASADGLCPRCVFAQAVQPTAGAGTAFSAPDLETMREAFPSLEVIELIGSGGMGSVFKARQPNLDRFVALKVLPSALAEQPGFAARFQREAQALASLNHPHIVTVHDFGQASGLFYLIMEFVDGVNLRQLLQAKRLTPKEALSVVPPVCEALQCAHDRGIVHRDIKPENLLINRAGVVKIADFGIAKIVGHDGSPPAPGEPAPAAPPSTLPLGTPDYAAPEQADGTADHRADIYSLGVVLYEMLTGERPTEKLEAPSKLVQVDIRVDEIVLRALAKTPELRFATAAEFRTQVEAATAETTRPNSPAPIRWRRWVAGFAVLLGLALWLGASVLSEMIDDAGLTLAARRHRERRESAAQAWTEAKAVAAGNRGKIADAKTAPDAGQLERLTREQSVLEVKASQAEADLNAAAVLKQSDKQQRISQLHFAAGLLLAAGLSAWFFGKHGETRVPPPSPGAPHLSRLAVSGACWALVTPVALATLFVAMRIQHDGVGPLWWQACVLMPLLLIAAAGPFGTTILGWLAVAEIARSHGRIHGLQLALFDGLAYPLMALSAILAGGITVAIRAVTGQPTAGVAAVGLAVAMVIVVDVLVVRVVLRAVRKDLARAPAPASDTANQVKLASLALIFALMSTGFGAFAAVRVASAWPVLTLAFLFAGLAIFMALPVRRLRAGLSALIIAALGVLLWSSATLIVRLHFGAQKAAGSAIVLVDEDRATITQPRSDLEGLLITFGPAGARWTPPGVYLEAMLDVTLQPHSIGQGATWVLKLRHGPISNYRLEGPPGAMLGKVVFHRGTPAREADGAYVIGTFQPDHGESLPLAVKFAVDTPSEGVTQQPAAGKQSGDPVSFTGRRGSVQRPNDVPTAAPKGETIGGVGLVLAARDGQIFVAEVLPQSPAEDSRRFQKEDTILTISEDGMPPVSVEGQRLEDVVSMIRGKVGLAVRIGFLPVGNEDGKPMDVPLTRAALTPLLPPSDDELRSLPWPQFDQAPGRYWRALADCGRFAEATQLIERYLALHPELSLGTNAVNAAVLQFHAAQCLASVGQGEAALKYLAAARHRQPTPGELLWNDYIEGTAAFLRGDKPALQAARDKLAAGPEINGVNTAVLDRLLENFGKPYREAYRAPDKPAR